MRTTTQPLTPVEQQAHIIADLSAELAAFKRCNRRSLDMLTDALHAHDAGKSEVVNEYLERVIEDLGDTAGLFPARRSGS